MDIPRKDAARRRWTRRITLGSLVIIAVPLATWGLGRLKPAAPLVERSTILPDTVKRGPMIRQVRGMGTLVPDEVFIIPALTDGRVERIMMLAGAQVHEETVLLVLVNPQLDLEALDSEYQVKGAEAKYTDLKVQLERERLTQQADVARIDSEYQQAKLKADRDASLAEQGLLADLNLKLSKATSDELAKRHKIEQSRLTIQDDSIQAQLAVQRAEIDKLRALAKLKRSQVETLRVRAGARGVLQELSVQVGQRVTAGTLMAKVAQPERLKAELKIPETQAKDVQIGQKAEIDTRNGMIQGRVSRIDPAVREGTVTVDVKLEGRLPSGARPDLSVDGTIELERLAEVVYVGRPAFGQQYSTVTMFRIEAEGKEAIRVPVKFGRSSVNSIEILEGLKPGDQVILSDMTAWDGHDRVRLN